MLCVNCKEKEYKNECSLSETYAKHVGLLNFSKLELFLCNDCYKDIFHPNLDVEAVRTLLTEVNN
jgi:hypothetical protein